MKQTTSLGHIRGVREIVPKRQYPFRYTADLDKDISLIYRLQYPPRVRNLVLIHSVKIASAYLKKIDPKLEMDSDKLKEIIKKDLNLKGEDLKWRSN